MTKPVIIGQQAGANKRGGGGCKVCLEHTFQEVLEKFKEYSPNGREISCYLFHILRQDKGKSETVSSPACGDPQSSSRQEERLPRLGRK